VWGSRPEAFIRAIPSLGGNFLDGNVDLTAPSCRTLWRADPLVPTDHFGAVCEDGLGFGDWHRG
jgi:hypothetical protein